MAVLCAIARHDDDLPVIPANRKLNPVDCVTRAYLAEDVGSDISVTRGRVEVAVDVIEEAGARGHAEA
jgi:hypothetical protein